ncbi:probable E3 ubiquitin-protein ligase HERC3 [Salminus brasiliensis]|uniref:probable E3 ubiquitin-protein ligase HERC3 n=1 Tax=Salminus brasiliensis TaxID=930266 RepID=UPI003B839F3C
MFYWREPGSQRCDRGGLEFGDGLERIVGSAEVTELSVRQNLLAFLSGDGKVTAVLLDGQGEEGQKQTQTSAEGKTTGSYKRFIIPLKERVQFLSSGKDHVVLVSEAGTVREWTYSAQSNIPRSFSNLTNRQISQVACGKDHSVVLTKDGQLFTWGENSGGQLGLGKGEPSSLSPKLLKSLCGIPLAQISAGGDHSFALSLSGTVFGWGRNSAGQLGLGDREDRHVPACVRSLNQKKTVFISCGEDHTAALTKGGLVFTFGSGCYGQLGHNSFRDELRPRLLSGLWGSEVSQIACGRHHTLALVRSSNTVFSFGCGEQGQLGNGQRTNQCVPLPVRLLPDSRQDQTVERVFAGGDLSVACCTKEGEIVSAGSSPALCEGTSVLDDQLLDRWILDCEKANAWNKVKREIRRMFSSASCINGSFVDKSQDKHYTTSDNYSGLDLSLARCAFEKLAKKQKILLEVESVVERDLLPSLENTAAAGVEALRAYLILPELLRVLRKIQRGTQLTIVLASAIVKLDQESQNVLTNLWTRLPYYYYRTLVMTFHSVATHFVSRMTTEICNNWNEASPPLHVLQKLYDINSQRNTRLTDDRFYIKEVNDFFYTISPNTTDEEFEVAVNFIKNVNFLLPFPFILDMRSKCKLFICLQIQQQLLVPPPCANSLCVNRKTVLADTLTYLKSNIHNFCFPLKVKFLLEDGFDAGGLRTEFFRLLSQDLTEASSLIQASEDSGLFWFSPDTTSGTTDGFYYFGVICGMAFYNQCYLNIGFPLALFKKLLHLSPTLSDLEELSPVEARGLKDLLTEDEDVVEDLYLDFTVQDIELIPHGQEIPVTKVNRRKYVDLYVDHFFNKSVEYQFKEFERGFNCGNYCSFWAMFLPEELRLLLYGTCEYEWRELQKIATYKGCGPSDVLIQNFWTVFFELSEELQKKFLVFMYASDRLPVGSLSQLRLRIVRHDYEDADERFPVAQTCFGTLDLPNYSNIDVLRERLVHAVTCCEVFGQV